MLYDYHENIPESDALAHAVLFSELEHDDLGSDDILSGLGFNASTGVDSAINNPGMLAVGLAMQEEWDNA